MSVIWGLLDQWFLSTGFFLTQAHLSVVFAFMRECSAATASHSVVLSRNRRSQLIVMERD